MNIVEQLRQEIAERQAKIAEIQSQCSHPPAAVEKKHGSNTGDVFSEDLYWTDFHCTLCGKSWNEEGSH